MGPRPFRAALLGAAILGVGGFAWLSVQIYRAQADPEGFRSPVLDPPASALNREAQGAIEESLRLLNDESLPAGERVTRYREALRRAEDLLSRSLRSQPAQARTLARLAAVRFELEPPLTPEANARFLATIETASDMAPRVPQVQVELGELLFRMGREAEAWRYLARAVELDPSVAAAAVRTPAASLVPPETIRRALPPIPEVLVALQTAYAERGEESGFLDAADGLLDRATPRLLSAYGHFSLRLRDPERLLGAMDGVGPRDDPAFEAERLAQRARAFLALGRGDEAVRDARSARDLLPEDPRFAETLGQIALGAKRPDEAIEAFREALALLGSLGASAPARARLYRQIGQAEEAAGRPQRAFDAYRRAVETDPAEAFAARRLREMESAAGVGEPFRRP